MSTKHYATDEDIQFAADFAERFTSGEIKQRRLPNTGKSFNEDQALESFRAGCENGILDEVARKVYE